MIGSKSGLTLLFEKLEVAVRDQHIIPGGNFFIDRYIFIQ